MRKCGIEVNNQDLLKQFFDDLDKSSVSKMYSYLIHYTPDYEYKSLKPYHRELENNLSSKAIIHYWGGENNDYFMNFCSDHSVYDKEHIKIYVPLNGENVTVIVTKIFNYIADNNIEHLSKLASETRTDDLVIRVTSIEDAKKIINFINSDAEICAGLYKNALPFDIKCGNVSVAYDKKKAFHEDVANYIEGYRQSTDEKLSLGGFKRYLGQLYDKKYCSISDKYDDHLTSSCISAKFDFDGAKDFDYDFKDYQLNTLNILLLIMRNLEGINSFEDFEEYYKMINNPLYKEDMEKLVEDMYIKTKQGNFYQAKFGISDEFVGSIQRIYNKDLSFYKGRVNGCVGVGIADIDVETLYSPNKVNADDMLKFFNRTGPLNLWDVSEIEFFIANGMYDLDIKNKIEQTQENELNTLKEWLQAQVRENIDLVNEYFLLKNGTYPEFNIGSDGNVFKRMVHVDFGSMKEYSDYKEYAEKVSFKNNVISGLYDFIDGPDYYLGYLSKLLELETKDLTSSQMQAVIKQKEMCKNALYNFPISADYEDVARRYEELGITQNTDLEMLATILADQYKAVQKQL